MIVGRIIFSGQAPEMKVIPGSPMVTDESIVVGPHNGLKNVIVFLKDAPKATFVLREPPPSWIRSNAYTCRTSWRCKPGRRSG